MNPSLNGSNNVVFSFLWKMDAEQLDIRGNRSIIVIEKETGVKTEFNSIRGTAKVLGMILNYGGYASPKDGKLYSFVDPSLPMREGSPDKPFFDEIDTSHRKSLGLRCGSQQSY